MASVSEPHDSGRATPAHSAYPPRQDPLTDKHPGAGREYAPTYWAATAGDFPADDGPIQSDTDADVVIVGSGFTGLAAALFLAREHGIRATVLEANRVAWGCTSRNGGQAQLNAGRLSRSQWIKRWGLATAQRMHREMVDAFDTFKGLVANEGIDCEPQPGGHILTAHRAKAFKAIQAEAKILAEEFDYPVELLSRDELAARYFDEHGAVGAMHEPEGIGVHPLKLVFGYMRLAREAGATVHPASPVLDWQTRDGVHRLQTPGGTVRARAVGIATGGYNMPNLHPSLRNRSFPILSNSMVTRPLTSAEKERCRFRTNEVITDSRTLRFYYRKLPDDRVQIGSRSSVTGRDAPNPRHEKLLRDGLAAKFPPLTDIQVDYSWWGWVDVSHDMMPRIYQPQPSEEVFYALGYGGNGVMYSAQAGRRLAGKIAHSPDLPDVPILQSPLPGHPLAPFRRPGQWLLYRYYYLRDELL